MRISESTRFPHPVLSPYTDDYRHSRFGLALDEVKEIPGKGAVLLNGALTLDSSALSALLASGAAVTGMMITCRDTYHDEWYPQPPGKFELPVNEGRLRGAVYIQGMVVAARDLVLGGDELVPGFGEFGLHVRACEPIAISEEHQLEIGFDKLVTMESIFSLIPDDSLPAYEFMVNTDAETIEIMAGVKLFEDIQLIRGTLARDALLPGLYVPVLMEALDVMRAGEFADRRWHRVMRAKCNAIGLVVDKNMDSLVEPAQRLLKSPFGLLGKVLGDNI